MPTTLFEIMMKHDRNSQFQSISCNLSETSLWFVKRLTDCELSHYG